MNTSQSSPTSSVIDSKPIKPSTKTNAKPMKELKDTPKIINSEPKTIPKRHFDIPNMWKLANKPGIVQNIKMRNINCEAFYKLIIKEAQRLYAPLEPIVFERDYRECVGGYGCSMHTWATGTIWLHLECSVNFEYSFQYDFNNCPFEDEITKFIEYLFSVNKQNFKQTIRPELFRFFEGINPLEVDREYFSVLTNG